jgi:hypothetical protein
MMGGMTRPVTISVDNFEFVGVNGVNAQTLLQRAGKEK